MGSQQHTVKTICKYCRREFQSFGLTKICPDCDKNMDRYFLNIREYIEENPNATVAQVCQDLGVPTAVIKFYLKEERLEVKSNVQNQFLRCEKCGKSINTGRFCFDCQITAMREDLGSVSAYNPENEEMDREVAAFNSKQMFNKRR